LVEWDSLKTPMESAWEMPVSLVSMKVNEINRMLSGNVD
jgi:hypothetical protein